MLAPSATCALLPVLFLSHGGGPAHVLDFGGTPFQVIDRNSKSAAFLRSLPEILETKYNTPMSSVRCILVVTAHWEELQFTVDYQTGPKTKLVYDYYGFPKEAYAPYFTYAAPTDLKVADRVYEVVVASNIPVGKKDRGWDHGTFMPLKVAFPEDKFSIPVVQLSLKSNLDNNDHIALGEALRPLREEGVLIIGSGQLTHNLGVFNQGSSQTNQFVSYIHELLTSTSNSAADGEYDRKREILVQSATTIPHFAFAHPRSEHYIPLLVAYGAGGGASGSRAERLYEETVMGSMAVDSYIFL